MTAVGDTHLPYRDANEGARELALALTAQTQAAARRLRHMPDTESLHDFRVALRRLRGCLRAYAPWLGTGRGLARRLRRIARATNAARDLEVILDWANGQRPTLAPEERAGASALIRNLEDRQAREYRHVRKRILRRWGRIEPRLRARLAEPARASGESFGTITATLIRRQTDALEQALAALTAHWDDHQAHRTRIHAKRLRYLLEPFRPGAAKESGVAVPAAGDAVAALKALQDELGVLQDMRVLMNTLRATVPDIAATHARRQVEAVLASGTDAASDGADDEDPLPGLLALAGAAARIAAFDRPSMPHAIVQDT